MTSTNGTEIKKNIMNNNNIGVASHSSNRINAESNLINDNKLAGVTFVNTTASNLEQHKIKGSQNGIFFDTPSTGNTVKQNDLLDNVVDLNNANGLALSVNKNSFLDNNCSISKPGASYVKKAEVLVHITGYLTHYWLLENWSYPQVAHKTGDHLLPPILADIQLYLHHHAVACILHYKEYLERTPKLSQKMITVLFLSDTIDSILLIEDNR